MGELTGHKLIGIVLMIFHFYLFYLDMSVTDNTTSKTRL